MRYLDISLALCASICGIPIHAQNVVYLSCDISSPEGKPNRHFDFTLDEQNGTVSYYVKEANAMNKEKALFGSDSVTWTNDIGGVISTKRTINRTDLSFSEIVVVAGNRREEKGTCSVVKAPERKF
jgi:hypothetical protein